MIEAAGQPPDPRFSVVIASYGRPALLRQTLDSVARCHPPPHEVIVVQGARAGDTAAQPPAVRAPGLTVHVVQTSRHANRQRNAGIEAATGDVVVFLDDDVHVEPDVFEKLAEAYVDRTIVGATGRIVEPEPRRVLGRASPVRRRLLGGSREGSFTRFGYPVYVLDGGPARDVEYMVGCFMSGRREAVAHVRFDEGFAAPGEDSDFSRRLSLLGRVRYLPDAVVYHRKTGFETRDSRSFDRRLVANYAYLFRKNFAPTRRARAEFGMFVVLLFAHRAANGDVRGLRGLAEGVLGLWQGRRIPQVIFVSPHARLGGAPRYLELLLTALDNGGREQVVCLEDGPFVDRLRMLGLAVTVVPTSRRAHAMLRSAWTVRRLLRDRRVAVVHANGIKAALVAALAAPATGTAVVWVKHDSSRDGWLAHAVAARCSLVVGVSAAVVAGLRRRHAAKLRVVHPGIPQADVDRQHGRALVADLLGEEASPRLAVVGRLDPYKGHTEVIELAPALLERFPRLRILFVGAEAPTHIGYRDRLARRIEELGIGEAVVFAGYRTDVTTVMSGCDVVVIASTTGERGLGSEGFGLVGVEAMAVGTPVVGYAVGALPEVLGPCARLVPAGDRPALGRALVDVLADGALRQRLGACGRELVQERYGLERMAEGMRACYREAAAGNGGGAHARGP